MRRSTALRRRRTRFALPKQGQTQAARQEPCINATLAKSTFIANIGHEIRTPMNAIMGFAQMLRNSKLNAQQRDYVDVIIDSGKKLLLIINNLLDLSNLQTGKIVLNPRPCNVQQTTENLWAKYSSQISAKQLNPVLDVSQGIPEVQLDCDKLEKVLDQLISNAIKFTPTGFVALKVSYKNARGSKPMLFIEVSDSGVGIAEERMDSIFDIFEQADNSITRLYEGMGIGLGLARQIVLLMGGSIWCNSTANQGSQFFIEIPAEPVKA